MTPESPADETESNTGGTPATEGTIAPKAKQLVSTVRIRSRSSKASRLCASAPVCTSGPPGLEDSTTWSTRSSTTRSMRLWPATPTRSSSRCSPMAACASSTTVEASGRSALLRPEQVDGRGRAHDPARRRKVRWRRLRRLRWSARCRILRRERAVDALRRRGEAEGIRLAAQFRRRRHPAAEAREGRGDGRDRNEHHVLAGLLDLHRDHPVRLRHVAHAVPADGLPQQGPPHRAAR